MSLPRFSVNNSVLVNVLMFVILVGGGIFAITLTREMFPESRPNRIAITALHPGVQPAEIEKAVTIKIEEAVRDVNGIEKVNSMIAEGLSSTVLTLRSEFKNVDAILQEVKAEIDAIEDLPDDLLKPTVKKIEPKLPVIGIALYGADDEAALKRAARELRDELLRLPGITDVEMGGSRGDEISVEVQPEKLYEFNVTFNEVAEAIRQTNLDVSGGQLKGDRSNISVRTLGEELRGVDLEDIVIRNRPDGAKILLRDVAVVKDKFIESDVESWFNGHRAVNCMVYKTGKQDVIQISEVVKAYVKGKQNIDYDPAGWDLAWNQPWWWRPFSLAGTGVWRAVVQVSGKPDTVKIYEESRRQPFRHNYQVDLHTDLSRFIEGRLDLLLRNGQQGFVLVLLSLLVFLEWRVALWTAWGIPTAFLGTFAVMWLMGVSINLISVFGLIIVVGIIVDDAIVIGENIYSHIQAGMPPRQAAIKGAEEVMWPVIVSVTTTIGAFSPLMFLDGQIGQFFGELPLVVMAALSVSLLEALLILPSHLAHMPNREQLEARAAKWAQSPIGRWQKRFAAWLDHLSHSKVVSYYDAFLRVALTWRYVTVAVSTSLLIASVGLVVGGVVEWQFIQKMDGETIVASVEMPVGSPAAVTKERLKALTDKARSISEVVNVQTHVAMQFAIGPAGADASATGSSHIGQLVIEIKAADLREKNKERSSHEITDELREFAKTLSGVNSISWMVLSGGPAGKDIELKLAGPRFDEIVAAAVEVTKELSKFKGVVDIEDDLDRGKREVQLQLREAARPTGITVGILGDHVRSAMYGKEAKRLTRNREDVKIMVRYPQDFRANVYNLESMWIPTGPVVTQRGWVPLSEIAELRELESYGTLHRSQQQRSVTVLADVQEGASSGDIVAALTKRFEETIRPDFPDVTIQFLGNVEEQLKSFNGLKIAMPIALLLIYLMVAGLFRSYYQPVVVMLSIPFGMMGAIVGHWVTGYPVTIISAIGFVALTGIVVNDAIVLVDYVNLRVRQGIDPFQANLEGSKARLRAIFLTSETTIAGLLPMLFERSFQAKFLIPMAVTISFGLLFSTLQTLLITPSINLIFFDILALFGVQAVPDEDRIENDANEAVAASQSESV